MKMKMNKLAISLLLTIVLTACGNEAVQTVEVTRLVPQTIEVTRVVPKTVVVTQVFQEIITATPKPDTPALSKCQPDRCTAYFDGAVVIEQYYTLLDQGLYEKAYQLFSTSHKYPQGLEDFIAGAEKAYKMVRIITIEPYYASNPEQEIQYYVKIYAEGEAGWRPHNIGDTFITVIKENGEWKIDSFANLPTH